MSDLISRQAAIDEVKRLHDVAWANWKETRISANTMIDALKELPSAQPEPSDMARDIATIIENEKDMRVVLRNSEQPEIIYCKNCKWKQGSECVVFADVRPFPDDFCSRTERKEDE